MHNAQVRFLIQFHQTRAESLNKKKTLRSLILRYKFPILVGIIALSIVDFSQLSIPLIIEKAIDALTIRGAGLQALTRYALYILGLAVVMSFFRFFWRYFILGASRKIEFTLRNEFFTHLQRLSFDFYGERKVGKMIEDRFEKVQASFSELTEKARESISGVKVVKAFVKEKSEVEDFENTSNEYL